MNTHTKNTTNEDIKLDDPNLPAGWKRDIKERPGKSKNKHEINIVSPDGKSFKTPSQLQKYLKSTNSDLQAADFDFTLSGKSSRKKRKSADSELSDSNENEPRRRSGRIQMKLRSHEGDNIDGDIGLVELKSLKKSHTPSPKKLKKSKDELDEIALSPKEPETKAVAIEITNTVEEEETTIIKKDNEGNIEEIVTETIITEKSDIDLIGNEDDKCLKVVEAYNSQNKDIDLIDEDKKDLIPNENQLPEIQVEKTTITTSMVETFENNDGNINVNNSNGLDKDISNKSHNKENGELTDSHMHSQEEGHAMHIKENSNNSSVESPIYSIKHSLITSQTTTTIETSTN